MKITARYSKTIPRSQQAIIIPHATDKDYTLPKLPAALASQVKRYIKTTSFVGNQGKVAFIQIMSGSLSWIVLAGVGNTKKSTAHELTDSLQQAFRQAQLQGASNAFFVATDALIDRFGAETLGRLVAEAAEVGCYSYTAYKSKKPTRHLKSLTIITTTKTHVASIKKGIREGQIVGEAMHMVRDYGNAPSNHITPSVLAEMAQQSGKTTGQKVTVLNEKQMAKEKMGGTLGVSKGSQEEARFIIMEHLLGKRGDAPIVLVGKGITFDSGGISIKPSAAMDEMKFDMSGGGTVIGIMHVIGKLKLPVNVIGLVPATENVPSGSSYKPGDILTYADGTTVEIMNTDAEGRIILGDALLYAQKYKPKAIIDYATLTGAIIVALSDFATALFSNNDSFAEAFQQSSKSAGERLWRMPLPAEARARVKSAVADLRNTSNKPGGGSITAAAFLEHFVKKNTPWIHLDIAGTAWNVSATPGMEHGATGTMVKSTVDYIKKTIK